MAGGTARVARSLQQARRFDPRLPGCIQPTSSRRAAKASLCESSAMSFSISTIEIFYNSTTLP